MKFSLGGMFKAFTKERLKSFAFTVGDLVITTAVVGGIGIITLGSVYSSLQTKNMRVRQVLATNNVANCLADMQSKGQLAGYGSTDEFMEAFKKNCDVAEVLTTEEDIKKHFADSYKMGNREVSPADYEGHAVLKTGESIALTYNKNYKPQGQFIYDPNEAMSSNIGAKNSSLRAVRGFIDVNGASSPNKAGVDFAGLATLKSNCNNVNLISTADGSCPNDFDPPTQVCDCAENPALPECQQDVVKTYCEEHPTDRNCICIKDSNSEYCTKEDSCSDVDCALPENVDHPCCYDPPVEPCCTLTEDNCAAENKTLNFDKCVCECTLKCSKNQKLDKNSCTCSCDIDFEKYNKAYADIDKSKQACECVPKDADARLKCSKNGGVWNEATCSCDCKQETKDKCKADTCGYAKTNEDNFCACECDETLFKANKESKAKSEDHLSGSKLKTALENTNFASDSANKCFVCPTEPVKVGNKELRFTKGHCSCFAGCANKPNNLDEYKPYFVYKDYDDEVKDESEYCNWSCNVEALNNLVDELNKQKAGDDLRPFAMDKYKKSNETYESLDKRITIMTYQNTTEEFNYKDFKKASSHNLENAQYYYHLALLLGKATQENGGDGSLVRGLSCEAYGCKDIWTGIYNNAAFNNTAEDSNGRFYRFLVYFNDVETSPEFGAAKGMVPYFFNNLKSRAAYGTNKELKDMFELRYVADPGKCAVYLKEFNYGKEPVDSMAFHGGNLAEYGYNLAKHWFDYEYAVNDGNFKVKNPNTQTIDNISKDKFPTPIKRPESFTAYNGEYGDANYWSKRKVGVIIFHNVEFDPLALNMSLDYPTANPSFDTKAGRVPINIHYDHISKTYKPVSVYWPKDYLFLVYQDYAKYNNVAYMFSDVAIKRNGEKEKEPYKTAFEQLKAEVDNNNDGLVNSQDKNFSKLALLKTPNKLNYKTPILISLTDKVFEINTSYGVLTDRRGRALQDRNAVYENYGVFRRLVEVNPVSTCSNGGCLVFKGWATDGPARKAIGANNNVSVEIWTEYNGDPTSTISYLYEPIGNKTFGPYSNSVWYKYDSADGSKSQVSGQNFILIHFINGQPYKEIQAKTTDIVFKSQG